MSDEKRLRGSQRVDEEDWQDEAKMEAAKKACSTKLVLACRDALEEVAERFGVEACDDEMCMFPGCLEGGCEGEPCDPATPEKGGVRRSDEERRRMTPPNPTAPEGMSTALSASEITMAEVFRAKTYVHGWSILQAAFEARDASWLRTVEGLRGEFHEAMGAAEAEVQRLREALEAIAKLVHGDCPDEPAWWACEHQPCAIARAALATPEVQR